MSSTNLKYITKLSKSRVLVLGGTSGIGFCVAEAALEHGASVIISSSSPAKLSRAIDRLKTTYPDRAEQVSGHTCDLSQPDSLEPNLEKLLTAAAGGSSIDHIVFTAGDILTIPHVSEATVDSIQKFSVVRFLGPMILAKVAPKHLSPGPTSSITLTGGVNAEKPSPGWTIATAYGAGLEGLTRGLAVDLKPVRVNMVAPGAVHTELFNSIIPEENMDGVLQKYRNGTTTGTVGRPEDLAEAYIYAMKDHFITGSLIKSNGGSLLV